jgi:hypothetical protein
MIVVIVVILIREKLEGSEVKIRVGGLGRSSLEWKTKRNV